MGSVLMKEYNVYLLSTARYKESKPPIKSKSSNYLQKKYSENPRGVFLQNEDDMIEIFWHPRNIQDYDNHGKQNREATGFWALRGKRLIL